jgi:hypothetical protein
MLNLITQYSSGKIPHQILLSRIFCNYSWLSPSANAHTRIFCFASALAYLLSPSANAHTRIFFLQVLWLISYLLQLMLTNQRSAQACFYKANWGGGCGLARHRILDRANSTPGPIQYSQWLEKRFVLPPLLTVGPLLELHFLFQDSAIYLNSSAHLTLQNMLTPCIRYQNWSHQSFFCCVHSNSSVCEKQESYSRVWEEFFWLGLGESISMLSWDLLCPFILIEDSQISDILVPSLVPRSFFQLSMYVTRLIIL